MKTFLPCTCVHHLHSVNNLRRWSDFVFMFVFEFDFETIIEDIRGFIKEEQCPSSKVLARTRVQWSWRLAQLSPGNFDGQFFEFFKLMFGFVFQKRCGFASELTPRAIIRSRVYSAVDDKVCSLL